jgi:excinuclease ABC subunit A
VDGEVRDLTDDFVLDKYKQHDIEIVVDRLVLPAADAEAESISADRSRLSDSVEMALKLGEGIVLIQEMEGKHGYFRSTLPASCAVSPCRRFSHGPSHLTVRTGHARSVPG